MSFRMMILSLATAAVALAGDVTGKWTAQVPGRDGNTRTVDYEFKVEGNTLTGSTSGFQGNRIQIADGKVDGDNISFKTKLEFGGNSFVMTYKGTVEGDQIKFTSQREGSDQTREFTAKRAK